MSGFLDQGWFSGIKDFNKNIGMRDFLNNTDSALGGTGITNWPNHFDDLYNSDRDVRSGTNLAALIYGGILAGGAMGAGSAGSGAGTGAGTAGAGAAGGAGAAAGEGTAAGFGAAEASPWVESSGGLYTLPGEGGSSAYGSLAEPAAAGGTNWFSLANKGMKLGNMLGGGQGQQSRTNGGGVDSTTAWINAQNAENKRMMLAQNLRNQKRMEDDQDWTSQYG